MKKDYQTHVFTSTYTADVSGVCSAMYELGGMSVLHDPSGCNSTYSTHDEPRWFDSDSLMFVSGLDETAAVMGDDSILIRDVVQAAADLSPRFITLCGASIPHIIAFDYRGVAHLIEKECGIPVLPVATDGLKSYTSGAGLAFTAWLERFADPGEYVPDAGNRINLLGVTPLDFSVNGNVQAMKDSFERAGFTVNCCMAMGDTFEDLTHIYHAGCNVVVSGAGRKPAKYMKRRSGIPYVEGLPAGEAMSDLLMKMIRNTMDDGICRSICKVQEDRTEQEPGISGAGCMWRVPAGQILVIGEEIYARSLAYAVNCLDVALLAGRKAYAIWPDEDEGIPEDLLIKAVRQAYTVIADPLYRVVMGHDRNPFFIDMPHEAYSGRIFRSRIPVFASDRFDLEKLFDR